jgi:hypothetical protein
MKEITASKDIQAILYPRYKPYSKQHLKADLRKKRLDPTFFYKYWYDGFITKPAYKLGVSCIWLIYTSRRKFESSLGDWNRCRVGGLQYREDIRGKLAKTPRCKGFMKHSRLLLYAAGYVEFPTYMHRPGSRLYMKLPRRFYLDMAKYSKGFNELDVLARMDKKKNGLLGTYIVHKKIEVKGVVKYVLQATEFGSIPIRNSQALSLRELILYGYYPIGRTTNEHLVLLTHYWNDHERKFYLPPEEGFIKFDRIDWKTYCARVRIMRRKRKEV